MPLQEIVAMMTAESDKLNAALAVLTGPVPVKKRRGRPPKSAVAAAIAAKPKSKRQVHPGRSFVQIVTAYLAGGVGRAHVDKLREVAESEQGRTIGKASFYSSLRQNSISKNPSVEFLGGGMFAVVRSSPKKGRKGGRSKK